MTSLPRHFIRNVLSNYGGIVVALLVALVLTPIMVRGLGREGYGVWGLATSAVQYFALLQLGFGRGAVRYVAAYTESGETDRLRTVVGTTAFALLVPGAVVLLASPGLAFLFPHIFHVAHSFVVPAMIVAALTTIDVGCSIPSDIFGATLIGLQRYDFLNLTVAGTSLAQAAGWIAIIALGGGLIPLGICLLGVSLVGQLSRYVFARRLLGTNVLKRRYFQRSLVRSLLSQSGWIALADLTDTINAEVDVIVVGIVAGVPQAAVYLVGQKLANLSGALVAPVQAIFYPHAARLGAAGDHEGLRTTIFTGTRLSLAVAVPGTLILAVLAKPALHAWVGPGFASAAPVIIFLAAAVVVNTIGRTVQYVLRGMGNVKSPALFGLSETVINLPLSVVLGLTIGFQGVALSTLIAEVVMIFGVLLPYSCRQVQISMTKLLWVSFRSNLLPSLAAVGVGLFLVHLGIAGLPEVIGAGAAMFVAYAIGLYASGISAAERALLHDQVARRLVHAS